MHNSKKQKELISECLSFVSFIQYQETLGNQLITKFVKELSSNFKSTIERSPNDLWLIQSSWDKLSYNLKYPVFETKINSINQKFNEIKNSNKSSQKRTYLPEKPLEEQSTKELLSKRRYDLYSDYDNGDEEATKQEKIHQILATKEHVLKPAQSKLIRKMSIHAGKKLSLREAQILNNQLDNKKK